MFPTAHIQEVDVIFNYTYISKTPMIMHLGKPLRFPRHLGMTLNMILHAYFTSAQNTGVTSVFPTGVQQVLTALLCPRGQLHLDVAMQCNAALV